MSVAGVRNRDSFGTVAGPYRVLAGDTGLITLVPAPPRSTIYVQKIHIQITTPSVGERWTFQDGKGIPLVPSVSADAVAHFDFNFGPDGVPCTRASAFVLNVTGATGAVGWITWTAFQLLTPMADYASDILALNPLAYWRFEEPGGNTLFDASGNFHHAFGGSTGGPGADLLGVRFQRPSALRNGTFGIQAINPTGLGVLPVTLTASPSTVSPTGTITVTWAGIPAAAQSASNWVALTKIGRPRQNFTGWRYITNSAAGSVPLVVTQGGVAPPDPGLYDLSLYYQDSWNLIQQIIGQVEISLSGPSGVSVSSPSPVPLVLGPTCTFECWFTAHGVAGPGYSFICGDNSNGLYLVSNTGVVSISLYYLGDHLSTPIALETKYYLAIVCNAGAVTFLLNGQPAGTAVGWPGITITNLLNIFPNGNLPLIADIDELVLYGFALNPDVIAAHAARWS